MFKPRVFRNALTEKIDNDKNLTLIDVLLHKEFYSTVRNESDILYKQILSKEKKWFEEILGYALFDSEIDKDNEKNNRVHQINHNASNFLEGCGKKFISYLKQKPDGMNIMEPSELQDILLKTVKKFISPENGTNQDRMYAGHFQRFIENFMRWKAFGDSQSDSATILNLIITFIINNCNILAYQQLLTHLLCDFTGIIDEETMISLFNQMLYLSCKAVEYIQSHSKDQSDKSTGLAEYKYNKEDQPINLKKEPIPLLKFDSTFKNDKINNSLLNIKWDDKFKTEKQFSSIEDAEMEGYLLIMSIRSSIYERLDIINVFRNDKNTNYVLIQSLFFCGVFSDIQSLISLEAFRLLDIIVNGLLVLDIEPWLMHESKKHDTLNFYDDYANQIIYDAKAPNLKMIQALPIFWSHRYNKKEYKQTEDESKELDVSDYYYKVGLNKTRKREEGETALEILQPCLFAEPPVSSLLINVYTCIFIRLLNERKVLRENNDHSINTLDSMVYLDCILIDFYRHHFNFGNFVDVKFSDLLDFIIQLPPDEPYFSKESKTIMRAQLNGFLLDFSLRMLNWEDNTFFDVDEDLPQTSISHCKEITKIDSFIGNILRFKDTAYLSALPEKVVFNISTIGTSYLDDEEEEEDNQIPKGDRLTV